MSHILSRRRATGPLRAHFRVRPLPVLLLRGHHDDRPHPDIAGLPELKLFCCRTIGALEASLSQFWIDRGVTHRSPGLVRALAEFEFGGQTAQSLSAAQAWLRDRPDWSGSDVLDVLLERLNPRKAVEKSPDDLETDAALTRMAAAYPRARYVHLTRHPVTTQRSMQEHWNRMNPSHSQDGEPMSGIGFWYEIHQRILHFPLVCPRIATCGSEAKTFSTTPNQFHAIAVWLGIRADGNAIERMRHPEASPFARPDLRRVALPVETTRAFSTIPSPIALRSHAILSRRRDGLQTVHLENGGRSGESTRLL